MVLAKLVLSAQYTLGHVKRLESEGISVVTPNKKTCFVIAPIGEPDSDTRDHSNRVLRHIIRKAVEPLGYRAVRADEISEPGMITDQIMQHVMADDLVVADLTGQNANVFYELAVRHAIRKPFVHIGNKEQTIPFDVSGIRLVPYDIQDLDSVESAVEEITKQVESWEGDPPPNVQTPISMPLEFLRISQSGGADSSGVLDILPLIQSITSSAEETKEEMQRVRQIVASRGQGLPHIQIQRQRMAAMQSENPYAYIVLINTFSTRAPWLYELGMEAFRLTMTGNTGYGREVFSYLCELLDFTVPETIGLRDTTELMGKLTLLFERVVDRVESSAYETHDLPF